VKNLQNPVDKRCKLKYKIVNKSKQVLKKRYVRIIKKGIAILIRVDSVKQIDS